MEQTNFKNRVALVTGAGSGIGRELVKRLILLGSNVIAVSQTQSKLDSLKEELTGSLQDNLVTVSVNLENWIETELKLSRLCQKVDFLVNNAGFGHKSPVDEVKEDDLDKLFNINLKAPINLIRLVSKGMKERKFGSIVNVSSIAGTSGIENLAAYSATKGGLDMVTRVSAKELGVYNIRVNSVNPTIVWTEMGKIHWNDPKATATMTASTPLGRFAEVREVIDPIIFLLSDMASMINGITMPIDGGFLAT